MSEIGLNINVDSYNNEGIKTIKGNNNAEIYKLYILKNKRRLSLVGKTIKLGYVMAGTTKGDIIENLNITNAEQGEITFPITNRISKQDGVYSCQLAIYGADGFLEHTATFGLTVEANIFTKIAGEIADSKDFTYLENILDKASKLSEKLKENTSSATNANSNLESNITAANNINSKLLENTSTATSLNKNLESNIDLAKEVKETIKDLDTKNIEATEKIETLTGLNAKATELSNNIQQGLPLNSELVKNVESAKTANNELIATNNDAKAKKTDLDNSLEEAKKYISGLDGSQNIPQLRLDVTELQNGLKSNQALAYQGSSISANDTLEGRTEGMRIGGRTLVNLWKTKSTSDAYWFKVKSNLSKLVNNDTITLIVNGIDLTKYRYRFGTINNESDAQYNVLKDYTQDRIVILNIGNSVNPSPDLPVRDCLWLSLYPLDSTVEISDRAIYSELKIIALRGDYSNKSIPQYFEGIKSFGEQEKVGDKYKISILSKSLSDIKFEQGTYDKSQNTVISVTTRITSNLIEGNFKSILNNNLNFKEFMTIIFAFDSDKRFISSTGDWSDNLETSNLPLNTKYIRIVIKRKNEKTISPTDMVDVYFGNLDKKDILIKEPLREGDIMYEDNGQVKVNRYIKQYTFTGDEENISINMSYNTESMAVFSIVSDVFNDKKEVSSQYDATSLFCNNFLCGSWFDIYSSKVSKEMIASSTDNNSVIYFKILKSKLTTPDVNGFKAWLKANPTTIVYQLATPTVEIVENCVDIDLDTYQEKTYFNILNSLPGTLDFKVPSNIASIVQNTAREVNNIWDVINNLLVPSLIDINKNVAMSTIKNNLK
ncbi:TPA: BppU family phage baseplate upper protein [Clostridium perfringens]